MVLADYFKDYDLDLTYIEDFEAFRKYLLEYNKTTNITRIVDEDEFNVKHFLDSLSLFKTNIIKDGIKIIDVGTGGGFPGLPIKLYKRDLDVTLLDSLKKRVVFLDSAITKLHLEGIRAIHSRAEELAADEKHREQYDLVCSRAVANLSTLSEYCLPFAKIGGYFVAMKGPEYKEELSLATKALKTLGGAVEDVKGISLPLDINHYLIVIKKIKQCPKKYPRQGGKPKSKPL